MKTAESCVIRLADGVGGNSGVNQSRFATTAHQRLRILETYRRIAMVRSEERRVGKECRL